MNEEYGFTPETVLSVLPEALRVDSDMVALAEAIAPKLTALVSMTDLCGIYDRIDDLPEEVLDGLAYDFKIDWYDYDYNITTKRRLLKSSFDVHRHLGTRQAVETAVQAVFPYSIVQEWFEYGGDPYCFRLVVNTTDHEDQEILGDGFFRAVTMYKSFRSHLDGIIFRSYSVIKILTGWGYIVYASRLCGTFPSTATQGAIERGDIIIETDAGNLPESIPATGSMEVGTHPYTATQGGIADGDIVILTDVVELASAAPTTGQINAGTHPADVVQGSIQPGGIVADTNSTSFVFEAPLCGIAPGEIL